jgi:ceramide glucosyltransferase
VITHPFPLALLGVALLGGGVVPICAAAVALLARLILKFRVEKAFGAASGPIWLMPVRDTISLAVFLASFFGQKVAWRGSRFEVQASGAMSQL